MKNQQQRCSGNESQREHIHSLSHIRALFIYAQKLI